MSDVLIIKLVTGEEILCEAHDEGNAWIITNPLAMFQSLDQAGKMTVQLGPFMPYIKDGMILSKAAVAIFGSPNEKLLEQYNTRFGKLIVPENKLIV